MKTLQTEDGRLYVVSGASRSGKTAYTVREVRKAARAMAWDPEDQWAALPGWQRITTRAALLEAAQKPGPARLAFVAGGDLKKAFDFWAGCAFHWGRYYGPCVVVAEELADVTTPSKAPGNWGILLRRGLKRGIYIWAISQRWAEADKTAMGNASEFIVFRASSADDAAYFARKTRLQAAEIEALQPLEFIRMSTTGAKERGKLRF